MTDVLALAGEQLREIADSSNGTVQVHGKAGWRGDYDYFEISIRFDGLERVRDGLSVRARESFIVGVPRTFPFSCPVVWTPHTRFAGFDHVLSQRHICLYPDSSAWRPEGGMYGFIQKLDAWIRDAAINNLDPDVAPLHPPVAYPTVNRLIVPKADTPSVERSPWFGFAEVRERNNRTEIIAWKPLDQGPPASYALAILLHEQLSFEYPKTVRELLNELEARGIQVRSFITLLAIYASQSDATLPLMVVLGTPRRRVIAGGPALQHLAVWEIFPADAQELRNLSSSALVGGEAQWNSASRAVYQWCTSATVGWCWVQEMRPEVTTRRDVSSSMKWFHQKRIAIWGCGAIGTHVAESVVRAGANGVELVDNKTVTPGLLVRQGFEDADIGVPKARALAERLKRINPDLETVPLVEDLIPRITGADPFPAVDLVIDCTASLAVRTAIEHALGDIDSRPAIASLAIDGRAATAMATLSAPNHSGGPLDLIRRLKLEACRKPKLSRILEAFWPPATSTQSFQPEPSCSEPTFIGSNADLAGLSARMLNAVASGLREPLESHSGAGWLFEGSGQVNSFTWPPDQILNERARGLSVRVCSNAAREMRSWAKRSVRTAGETVETGGLVFGELNEAAGVLWVTEVEGPPPDSDAAEDHFTCGIEGMENAARARLRRYRGSVECIGTWHTHPISAPYPSRVDISAVRQLLTAPGSTRRTCLILILSGNPDDPVLGAYSFRRELSATDSDSICIQPNVAATARLGAQPKKGQDVGLALSGGGSRAIAFHLGCLRALHDLSLLGRVQVISSVSGGSVISAMYAYADDSFEAFDARVVELLRRGLQREILWEVLRPSSMVTALKSLVFRGMSLSVRKFVSLLRDIIRPGVTRRWVPLPREFSRTEAFRNVLANSLFGDTVVRDVGRRSLHTVINATELRTGSAFRFGSKQSGCWRFGTIASEDALLADAVAASAAYPAFLPALERQYSFTKNGRTTERTHVLLTDGGVFENLGVGPMEPGRVPSISTNVFEPEYIICCDAGEGLFDCDSYPKRLPSRLYRSFLTVFRKVQDATRKRLHDLSDAGEISGFAHCYLGQQEDALPWIPAGLPRRDDVRHYPTDFAAMSTEDIDRLALRGEHLMRFLVAYYLPDL